MNVARLAVALFAALVAGCGSEPPRPSPAPTPSPAPAPVPAPSQAPARPQTPPSAAAAQLLAGARGDIAAGRLDAAGATLERALRLEPRNPWLWHELARVRLGEGKPAEALGLAARSDSVAGADAAVRAANARLAAEARAANR